MQIKYPINFKLIFQHNSKTKRAKKIPAVKCQSRSRVWKCQPYIKWLLCCTFYRFPCFIRLIIRNRFSSDSTFKRCACVQIQHLTKQKLQKVFPFFKIESNRIKMSRVSIFLCQSNVYHVFVYIKHVFCKWCANIIHT